MYNCIPRANAGRGYREYPQNQRTGLRPTGRFIPFSEYRQHRVVQRKQRRKDTIMDNEGQEQVNKHVTWFRFMPNLLTMIFIYATSAGLAMLVIYWLADWLDLTDS